VKLASHVDRTVDSSSPGASPAVSCPILNTPDRSGGLLEPAGAKGGASLCAVPAPHPTPPLPTLRLQMTEPFPRGKSRQGTNPARHAAKIRD